jgi:hypothetical protein
MVSEIIQCIKPSMIHVNGTTARKLVEEFYCTEQLQTRAQEHSLMFGHAQFGETTVEVMAHQQLGSRNGPSSKHWPGFIDEWRRWRSENEQGPAY